MDDFFEGTRKESFEAWVKQIVGRDERYSHLLIPEYEEERADFYVYFLARMSPWQALQEEYQKYG